jgi:hypothetical protein
LFSKICEDVVDQAVAVAKKIRGQRWKYAGSCVMIHRGFYSWLLDVCKTTNFTSLKAIYRFKSYTYIVFSNAETLVRSHYFATWCPYRIAIELDDAIEQGRQHAV